MIITTTDIIPGTKVQILGLVRGNVVTSRHMGKDIMASARSMVGGEIKSYTEMTNDARAIAEERMVAEAQSLSADAVMSIRFGSETITPGTIEMLAYGTAVKFLD